MLTLIVRLMLLTFFFAGAWMFFMMVWDEVREWRHDRDELKYYRNQKKQWDKFTNTMGENR